MQLSFAEALRRGRWREEIRVTRNPCTFLACTFIISFDWGRLRGGEVLTNRKGPECRFSPSSNPTRPRSSTFELRRAPRWQSPAPVFIPRIPSDKAGPCPRPSLPTLRPPTSANRRTDLPSSFSPRLRSWSENFGLRERKGDGTSSGHWLVSHPPRSSQRSACSGKEVSDCWSSSPSW